MKAELDAARPPPSPVELVTAIPAGTRWQVELVTAESSVLGRAVFWRRADALKAASAAAIAAMGIRRIPVLRKRKTCVTINFKHGE